ncbi:MAG: IS630 family transposase [Victivallaceae bacterium]
MSAKKKPEEHAMDQKVFLETKLQPLLEECKEGKRDVLFVDASHFVFGSFVCALWCITRKWVRAASGRQRHNVLGALHATTHELTTVINDTYVNAETVCELLMKLRMQAAVGRLITVVLDNAKYQTCDLVVKCAAECAIDLCFLPSYSPNLNLIERYWKYTKKTCLYGKYYATFKAFKAAIDTCIIESPVKDKEKLDSLLTLKFQSFKNAQLFAD